MTQRLYRATIAYERARDRASSQNIAQRLKAREREPANPDRVTGSTCVLTLPPLRHPDPWQLRARSTWSSGVQKWARPERRCLPKKRYDTSLLVPTGETKRVMVWPKDRPWDYRFEPRPVMMPRQGIPDYWLRVRTLRNGGMSEAKIAKALDLTHRQVRQALKG